MNHKTFLRRALAGCFLLLFIFCVTPKRFLHDVLANHKDLQSSATSATEHVTSSGFQCHADDLVVVAPFMPGIDTCIPAALPFTIFTFAEPLSTDVFLAHSTADGRGPPADFLS